MVRRPRQTIQATTIRQKEEYTSERNATERGASNCCKLGISWSIRGPPCGGNNFGSYHHPKCIRPHEAPPPTLRNHWKSVKTKSEGTPIVLKIIVSGHVDAIVGVACLNVLEKALDKVLLAGIPCV